MINTYKRVILEQLMLLFCIFGISACGGSGSCSSCVNNVVGGNGDVNMLQIIPPRIIYSKSNDLGIGYVVINNPTESAVKNLHYSLANVM